MSRRKLANSFARTEATLVTQAPRSAARQATPSPVAIAGPAIVFNAYSPDTGMDGIFLAATDGSQEVEITAGVGPAFLEADWSPSGGMLAFRSDGPASIWIADAGGANVEELVNDPVLNISLEDPAWSPDGTKIAFTRKEHSGAPFYRTLTTTVRVYDLRTKVTSDVYSVEFPQLMDFPRWSPDGDSLVFSVDTVVWVEGIDYEAGSVLAIAPAGGGEAETITEPELFAFDPDWNRVTGELVYGVELSPYAADPALRFDPWNLFAVKPDGSGGRQITHLTKGQKIAQPTWTPDGTAIIATFDGGDGINQLVLVDPDSGQYTLLAAEQDGQENARLQP